MGLCASKQDPPVAQNQVAAGSVVWSIDDPKVDLVAANRNSESSQTTQQQKPTPDLNLSETVTTSQTASEAPVSVEDVQPETVPEEPVSNGVITDTVEEKPEEKVPPKPTDADLPLGSTEEREVEVHLRQMNVGIYGGLGTRTVHRAIGLIELEEGETLLDLRYKIVTELDKVPSAFCFMFFDTEDDRLPLDSESTKPIDAMLDDDCILITQIEDPAQAEKNKAQREEYIKNLPPDEDTDDEFDYEESILESVLDETDPVTEAVVAPSGSALRVSNSSVSVSKTENAEKKPSNSGPTHTPSGREIPRDPPKKKRRKRRLRKKDHKPRIIAKINKSKKDTREALAQLRTKCLKHKWLSIESQSHSGAAVQPMASQNFFAKIQVAEKDCKMEDFTFRAREPLFKAAGKHALSLESLSHPGWYLRHENDRIKLEQEQEGKTWKRDASWKLTPALSEHKDYISFESVSKPGWYIKYHSQQLYLEKPLPHMNRRKEASFCLVYPYFEGPYPDGSDVGTTSP